MAADGANGTLAAVDLGSNSFHMVIGRVIGEQISLVDRLREPVRLAAGLDARGRLDEDTVDRALACLRRFAERLRDVHPERVRVVGTNTLRRAKQGGSFLSRGREVLGVPIEIISGLEEARLIYLGVSHGVAFERGARLVIDIGGGSTECIVGEGFEPKLLNTLHMGCVSWTRRHFGKGRITREAYRRAELEARRELEPIERLYRKADWGDCVGSSGTVRAIQAVVRAAGWTESWIHLDALANLRAATIAAGSPEALRLDGLSKDRALVLPGGLAILTAMFESFRIERMRTSDYALREGILYDLLGRIEREDVRDRTVQNLAERHHVDPEQAERVGRTAAELYEQTCGAWGLDHERGARYLSWAARLAEIGLAISYGGHHKHGAYIVQNSTLAGFSREGQVLLATIIRGHRRKISRDPFDALPPYNRELGFRLCLLLRVAATLNRGRGATDLPELEARAEGDRLELVFPSGWLDEQPLTSADLAAEAAALAAAGVRFSAA